MSSNLKRKEEELKQLSKQISLQHSEMSPEEFGKMKIKSWDLRAEINQMKVQERFEACKDRHDILNCPHYLKVQAEAIELIKRHKEKMVDDSLLTRYCVRLRLEGVSYPKIVRDLIDRGYSPMSWQSIQNRVNRYKNRLYIYI